MAVKVGHMGCWHSCVGRGTFLRRETIGWRDTPDGIIGSKEEDRDHGLSV